ncbi:MAG: D-alanine--D-alanine ligase [Saprospiraceae bacterium]|nr:D-alanine--D-alanine ligase [Saprospiraceae bacterium]
MMKKKIAVVFGGKSAEHEVSLNSASNIFNAIDLHQFDAILLGVDPQGRWQYNPEYPTHQVNLPQNDYFAQAQPVWLDNREGRAAIISKTNLEILDTFDAAFSIIHGTNGEDGVMQGFFRSLDIPFVGPDVLGSAVCMDKDVTKRLLRDFHIPLADSITLFRHEPLSLSFAQVVEKLGLPLFVKPSNAGSSVGVSKVTDEAGFHKALAEAFKFDHKILIEEAVIGKEVECAVLGNEHPKASVLGEIIPVKDFYSYEAKYKDADGALLNIPADIDPAVSDQIRQTAVQAFQIACCEGLARVDFFLRSDNSFVLNEINTLPGFTEISMYPKMWEATGLAYSDLITQLVELGMARHERDSKLKTNRQ